MPVSWYRDWAELHREFPGYPNGVMALGLRESAHQDGCRTILSGVGGDEWLGMPWTGAYYAEELADRQWKNVYACLKTDAQELGVRKALWWLLRYGVAPLLPEQIRATIRKARGVKGRETWLAANLQEALARQRGESSEPFPTRLNRRGQGVQIKILEGAYDALARESEERLTSSISLELRKPFFNEKIIQFAFATPERLRSHGHTTKWLHRQALQGLLPASVLNRATKADFMSIFRRHLDALERELVSEIAPRRSSWVHIERAISMSRNYHGSNNSGWAEWWLWSLVGCDALLGD